MYLQMRTAANEISGADENLFITTFTYKAQNNLSDANP